MSELSYDELRKRLAAECRPRKWRLPSRRRLKKLRCANQLPPAISVYEKGKRVWRYPANTIAAYIRTEELRRESGGKRVRSWNLIATREKSQVLREWLAQPDLPVPRDLIAEVFEGFSRLFSQLASGVYSHVERPVGPFEDSRIDGAHNAIDSMLDAADLNGPLRNAADALLQMLIFRDEDGNAENVDLEELLEPIRQQAGPFWLAGKEIIGLCSIFRDAPINEFLTHPRALLEAVSDGDLRASVQTIVNLAAAIELLAELATVIISHGEKARSAGWNVVPLDWFKPLAKVAASIPRFIGSEEAPWLLCASALVNVSIIRRDPNAQAGIASLTASLGRLAAETGQSKKANAKSLSSRLRRATGH
jgi:hypothetical protein